jgi:hypothetical protein
MYDVLLQLCLGDDHAAPGDSLWDDLLGSGHPREGPVFLERPHYSPEHLIERAGKEDPQRYVHGEMIGVVASQLKFILGPDGREQLFDLEADPNESHNLADERPADTERLRSLLKAWQQSHPIDINATDNGMTESRRQALKQLGYGH